MITVPFATRRDTVFYYLFLDGYTHSRLRYSQLKCLHQQLCRHLGNGNCNKGAKELGIQFPSKSFLPLNDEAIGLRCKHLQNYLNQLIIQKRILRSHVFCGFFVSAQWESWKLDDCADANSVSMAASARGEPVMLHVWLANGSQCHLSVAPDLHTDAVLELLGKQLRLPTELTFHFSLFVACTAQLNKANRQGLNLLRRLLNIEAPYLSMCAIGRHLETADNAADDVQKVSKARNFAGRTVEVDSLAHVKLVLLKTSWNISYEQYLCSDPVALDLLYAQRASEWPWRWFEVDDRTSRHLSLLQERGDKLGFLERVRALPRYGHIQLDPCVCFDTNNVSSKHLVHVSIGVEGPVIRPCDSHLETSSFSQGIDLKGATSDPGQFSYDLTRYLLKQIHISGQMKVLVGAPDDKQGNSDTPAVSATTDDSASTSAAAELHQQQLVLDLFDLYFDCTDADVSTKQITLQSYQGALIYNLVKSKMQEIDRDKSGAPDANRLCPGVLRPCDKLCRTDYQYLSRTGRLISLQLPSESAASSTAIESKVWRSDHSLSPVFQYSDLMRRVGQSEV